MRVMCTVSAWPSHWFPLVPTLWGLRAAGHQVRVLCAPSQGGAIAAAGLSPAPVLAELDIAFLARLRNVWDAQAGRWPYPWVPPHPVTGEPMISLSDFGFPEFTSASQRLIARPVGHNGDTAIRYAQSFRPDLVLYEPLAVEGLLAARVTGIAAVAHLWGPLGSHETDPAARACVEFPVASFRAKGGDGVTLDTAEHVIDPCPPGITPEVATHRMPVRYLPYNGPGAMASWVLAQPTRPRVAVVWGNSLTAMYGAESFAVPVILDALAGLDVEVVVTTGARDTVERWPANARVVDQMPLHLLLPSCTAVVHHGGAGCLMTAVAAGVPQIVLPTGMDQPVNAARIATAGAGVVVPRAAAEATAIRAAVARVLADPEITAAARHLQREASAMPAPADLAATLAELRP